MLVGLNADNDLKYSHGLGFCPLFQFASVYKEIPKAPKALSKVSINKTKHGEITSYDREGKRRATHLQIKGMVQFSPAFIRTLFPA